MTNEATLAVTNFNPVAKPAPGKYQIKMRKSPTRKPTRAEQVKAQVLRLWPYVLGYCLPVVIGVLFGAPIPALIYNIAHHQTHQNQALYAIVAAGLIYSAKTVFEMGTLVFESRLKAFGFVVLLEAGMTCTTGWTAYCTLTLLMLLNSAACVIVARRIILARFLRHDLPQQ